MRSLIALVLFATLHASALGVYTTIPFKPVQSEISRAGDLGTLIDLREDLGHLQRVFDIKDLTFEDAAEFCETAEVDTITDNACMNVTLFVDGKL